MLVVVVAIVVMKLMVRVMVTMEGAEMMSVVTAPEFLLLTVI